MSPTAGKVSGPVGAGPLCILAASVLWGTTGTAATFAPQVGPLAVGAAAMGVGGLLQGLVAAPRIRREAHRLRAQRGRVLLGALAVGLYPLAFYSSMHLAGVAAGSVVSIGSAPIASAVIERLVDGRRFTRRWTTGAVLGVSGTVLLTLAQAARTHPGEGSRSAGDAVLGLSLALVAGVSYALYSWTARRLLKGGTTPPATMGALFGLGGVLLLPLLVIVGDPLVESWPNAAVGTYMALVPMFLGYTLFGRGLAHVPASTATTLSLLEPAVAAVLAVLVVGERLSPPGWGGITLLLGALAVLTAPPRRSTDAHTVAVPDPVTPDRLPPPAQAPREPAHLGHTKTDHLPVDGFPRRGREAGT